MSSGKNYLVIDTTSGTNLAFVSENGASEVLCAPEANQHLETIAVLTQQLQNGRPIDEILVSAGPASYTGLRIGLSFARGLAAALEIPLRAFSTHDLAALYYQLTVIQTNAKRRQKFISAYSPGDFTRISMQIQDDDAFEETAVFADFANMAQFLVQNFHRLELPLTPIYLRDADATPNIKPPIVPLMRAQTLAKSLHIVQAETADLDALIAFENAVFSADAWSSDLLQNALNNPKVLVLKAILDGKIVGVSITTLPNYDDLPADLDSLGVLPENRRQNIGNKLLQRTIELVKSAGFSRIILEVRSTNYSAQALYKSANFKQIDIRKRYYGDDDALIMELSTSPGEKTASEPAVPRENAPIVMGIESSCDETGVAFVQDGCVLGAALSSSMSDHAKFGGVIPEIASRAHESTLSQITREAILGVQKLRPNFSLRDISAVAHASAPGLVGALAAGSAFAKGVALALRCPIYAVNHIDAHILASGIRLSAEHPQLPVRFLGVIVSGGHTALVVADGLKFTPIGTTLDDAAGEAFDKVGRILGLEYPAGPAIDALAKLGNPHAVNFPRPLTDAKFDNTHKYDFSFSGLKTAAIHELQRQAKLPPQNRISLEDFCASFAECVADVLVIKIARALDDFSLDSVVLGGGFSANSQLRQKLQRLQEKRTVNLHIPPQSLCTDNAQMVAYLADRLLREKIPGANLNYSVKSVLSPDFLYYN
jgi:N6-L-threonylcarbamoyladenine synthase